MSRLQALGWLTFLAGVVLFLVAAIRDGDAFAIWGSVLFIAGIGMFLAPDAAKIFRRRR